MKDSDVVVIAKVGAAYGLKGFCKLNEFSENTEQLLKKTVFMKKRGIWQAASPFELMKHAGRLMVRFLDCETPEATVPYVNLQLAINKADLPVCDSEHEFYWAELEGMRVVNQDHVALGQVQYLFDSGASDILVIQGEKEYLIPFVKDFVISIHREDKLMVVNWDPEF